MLVSRVPVRNPGGPDLTALVDEADAEIVNQHDWTTNWTPTGECYAVTTIVEGDRRFVLGMHQLLCRAPAGRQVDHKNNDGLDNRRVNLRRASKSQNQANSGKHRQNTSGYKGVTKHKRSGKWQAQISKDGRMRHIGLYADPADAARAYDRVAIELYGEFARPNFVKTPTR